MDWHAIRPGFANRTRAESTHNMKAIPEFDLFFPGELITRILIRRICFLLNLKSFATGRMQLLKAIWPRQPEHARHICSMHTKLEGQGVYL